MTEELPGWVWEEVSQTVEGDTRTTVERLRRCSCDGGWCEDKGWSAYPHGYTPVARQRVPEDGLVPCGFCNFGGWDAPWPAPATP